MRGLGRCVSMVLIMLISIQIPSIVAGDTVITAEEIEVFEGMSSLILTNIGFRGGFI